MSDISLESLRDPASRRQNEEAANQLSDSESLTRANADNNWALTHLPQRSPSPIRRLQALEASRANYIDGSTTRAHSPIRLPWIPLGIHTNDVNGWENESVRRSSAEECHKPAMRLTPDELENSGSTRRSSVEENWPPPIPYAPSPPSDISTAQSLGTESIARLSIGVDSPVYSRPRRSSSITMPPRGTSSSKWSHYDSDREEFVDTVEPTNGPHERVFTDIGSLHGYLETPAKFQTVFRLIHALNAPWAIDAMNLEWEEHTPYRRVPHRQNFSTWVWETSKRGKLPLSCYAWEKNGTRYTNSSYYIERTKFAFDYVTAQKQKHSGRGRHSEVITLEQVDDTDSSQRVKHNIYSRRLCIMCLRGRKVRDSDHGWDVNSNDPLNTIIIFEDTNRHSTALNFNNGTLFGPNSPGLVKKLGIELSEFVLTQVFDHLIEEWLNVIEIAVSHARLLVRIFHFLQFTIRYDELELMILGVVNVFHPHSLVLLQDVGQDQPKTYRPN